MAEPLADEPGDEIDWDSIIDPATGWLVPGTHEVELDELSAEFVLKPSDPLREHTWAAFLGLLHQTKVLYPSGRMLLAGTFVSRQVSPVDILSVVIVPDEPTTVEQWTEAEWDRFYQHVSLYDVILGSLGPTYMPVLHPFGGRIEVIVCHPDDADDVMSWMGAVLLADGREMTGARGVAEVVW
jgi:hypothetical protein